MDMLVLHMAAKRHQACFDQDEYDVIHSALTNNALLTINDGLTQNFMESD